MRRATWNGSVLAAIAITGVAVMLWVSLTLALDLIFHFHPISLGTVAGWMLRKVGAPTHSLARTLFVAGLATLGVAGGTVVIDAQGGPLDPHTFTAAMTAIGVGPGHLHPTRRLRRPRDEEQQVKGSLVALTVAPVPENRAHLHRRSRFAHSRAR